MVEVPKGRQIIATGVSPWVHRSRTISPAGAEDKTAADFRPVGAYREYRDTCGLRRRLLSCAPSGLAETRRHEPRKDKTAGCVEHRVYRSSFPNRARTLTQVDGSRARQEAKMWVTAS